MSVCIIHNCSQFSLGSHDLVEKFVYLDVDQISDLDVECISVAYYANQFVNVLCNQTYECPVPLVADALNFGVNISVDIINLVVNFSTVDNEVNNLVINFSIVGYTSV